MISIDKTCAKCNEQFPADREFFYGARREKDGLRSICKACYEALPSVLRRKKKVAA
ncbi:MAG: hypothetical protein AABY68_05950 [Pseudomonadota bacterium]